MTRGVGIQAPVQPIAQGRIVDIPAAAGRSVQPYDLAGLVHSMLGSAERITGTLAERSEKERRHVISAQRTEAIGQLADFDFSAVRQAPDETAGQAVSRVVGERFSSYEPEVRAYVFEHLVKEYSRQRAEQAQRLVHAETWAEGDSVQKRAAGLTDEAIEPVLEDFRSWAGRARNAGITEPQIRDRFLGAVQARAYRGDERGVEALAPLLVEHGMADDLEKARRDVLAAKEQRRRAVERQLEDEKKARLDQAEQSVAGRINANRRSGPGGEQVNAFVDELVADIWTLPIDETDKTRMAGWADSYKTRQFQEDDVTLRLLQGQIRDVREYEDDPEPVRRAIEQAEAVGRIKPERADEFRRELDSGQRVKLYKASVPGRREFERVALVVDSGGDREHPAGDYLVYAFNKELDEELRGLSNPTVADIVDRTAQKLVLYRELLDESDSDPDIARKRFEAARQAPTTRPALPHPQTEAERDALPVGTRFVWIDGEIYHKLEDK